MQQHTNSPARYGRQRRPPTPHRLDNAASPRHSEPPTLPTELKSRTSSTLNGDLQARGERQRQSVTVNSLPTRVQDLDSRVEWLAKRVLELEQTVQHLSTNRGRSDSVQCEAKATPGLITQTVDPVPQSKIETISTPAQQPPTGPFRRMGSKLHQVMSRKRPIHHSLPDEAFELDGVEINRIRDPADLHRQRQRQRRENAQNNRSTVAWGGHGQE